MRRQAHLAALSALPALLCDCPIFIRLQNLLSECYKLPINCPRLDHIRVLFCCLLDDGVSKLTTRDLGI